jgi:NADPH:quinone reductase-like Zn-dependent oxidoreductase
MRAYRLDNSAAKPALVAADIPQPQPQGGEVLIRVGAAGVTATELSWYPTTHRKAGENRVGAVPSHEFSGTVAAAGRGVEEFAVGRQVFGMNDWYSDGAPAEYCVAPSTALAVKPAQLSQAEAASVPIPALTAWQGLMDRAKVAQGDRVLVHGAAGAVGIFAVRIARLAGARIIATASAANAGFVKGLGAEQVVDYRATRFEAVVEPMDIVFDTVGGDTLERFASDAGDVHAQQTLAKTVGEAFGELDVLVVNAGIADMKPLENWTEAAFDRIASACPPSCARVASSVAAFRPVIATRAPSARNCRAVSSPMPVAPPVISASLPLSLFISCD